jgi:hypothetical protein
MTTIHSPDLARAAARMTTLDPQQKAWLVSDRPPPGVGVAVAAQDRRGPCGKPPAPPSLRWAAGRNPAAPWHAVPWQPSQPRCEGLLRRDFGRADGDFL